MIVGIKIVLKQNWKITPIGSIGSGILHTSGTLDVVNFGVLPFGNYFVWSPECRT